jgi:hypothetical protein
MISKAPKKWAILAAALFFTCINVKAQHLVFLYGHAIYGTPVEKSFKDGYNTGIGVEAGAGVGWKKTFIVGTVGFTNFFHESGNPAGDFRYVPVKGGIRQYIFLKNIYVHGDLGLGNIKTKEGSDSRFSGDIGAGVKFTGFEAQLDYNTITGKSPAASWIEFKAGFAIGL